MVNQTSTEKSGLFCKSFSLTRAESEVLSMITDEFLTLKQIRIRRNCTKQAVYKIVKSLRTKGALTLVNQRGGSSQLQRLHAQQFRIRIINKSDKYSNILKSSNLIKIDENTIRLYNDVIEIYSAKSFFGPDETEATNKSLEYWTNFIHRLENEFKVILIKPRSQNIKLVKSHYAEINSELAKESEKAANEIKVYCKDDGKLSVIMDNSFNLNERECIHPDRNKQHSEAISKQVSCFIEDNPLTNTELANLIEKNAQQLKILTESANIEQNKWNNYGEHIKTHTSAMIGLEKGITKFNYLIENLINHKTETYKKLKQQVKLGRQTSLGEYK